MLLLPSLFWGFSLSTLLAFWWVVALRVLWGGLGLVSSFWSLLFFAARCALSFLLLAFLALVWRLGSCAGFAFVNHYNFTSLQFCFRIFLISAVLFFLALLLEQFSWLLDLSFRGFEVKAECSMELAAVPFDIAVAFPLASRRVSLAVGAWKLLPACA